MNEGRLPVHAAVTGALIAMAVWGSWHPFDFRARPLDEAAWQLVSSARLDQPISLTDAASNFLLFLPLGLFAAASLKRQGPREALSIVAVGALLSTVIEYGQAFTLWRTPSLLDVAAETMGCAAGVAIWYPLADELNRVGRLVIDGWRRAGRAERGLWAYTATFAFVWLLPFDFTLRPDEIGDKYSHLRLLWPMAPSPDAATPLALAGAVLAAVPLGAAGMLCGTTDGLRRSVPAGCAAAGSGVAALTVLQVPVFSRTTDLTVACVALAGVMGGALLARPVRPERRRLRARTVPTTLIIAVWLVATATVEWWPLQFDLDVGRGRRAVAEWADAPFRGIAWGDLLPSVALAAAAGAAVRQRTTPTFVRLQVVTATALAGMALLGIEGIRLLVPGGAPTLVAVGVETAAFVTPLTLAMLRPPEPSPRPL